MRTGRPLKSLFLESEEQTKLELMARRPKTDQRTALRARIVLDCAAGLSNTAIAQIRGVTIQTVGKWRERFRTGGLEALGDAPRCGQPRKLTDAKVEAVITRTLETRPKNATHWSTRTMAQASGLNQNAIVRIWRAFGLKPHLQENFKLSTDAFFVEKVRDIVGLYLNPPERTRAVVLCVDEKSQVQALDRSEPVLPMRPGQAQRRTHDYYRHGTTSLFAALDIATGKIIGRCQRQHRQQEFIRFLNQIERTVPAVAINELGQFDARWSTTIILPHSTTTIIPHVGDEVISGHLGWLLDLLSPHRVILITARPNRYQDVTLARIAQKTGWSPMDAYFAEISSRPHMIKEHLLKTRIFPKYGESGYFGLESNPMTRGMYARYGIAAIRVTDQELMMLPG